MTWETDLEERRKKILGISGDTTKTNAVQKKTETSFEERRAMILKESTQKKPSQVAAEEIKPKEEPKKQNFFEKAKTGISNIFSSLSSKKKIEEQLKLNEPTQLPEIDTSKIKINPPLQNGPSIYDIASKEAVPSAKLTPEGVIKAQQAVDKAKALGTAFYEDQKKRSPSLRAAEDIVLSLTAGSGDVLSGTGNAIRWMGNEGLGQKLIDKGGELQKFMPDTSEDIGELDWKDMFNPRLYTTYVARGSAFTLAMMPLAIVGGYAGAGIAGVAGLGLWGTTILAAIGGSALATPFEAATEAGGVYDEMLQNGATREEADAAADKTFKGNMALLGITNTLQLVGVLGDIIKGADKVSDVTKTVSRTQKVIKTVATVGGEVISEGGEEVGQKNIALNAKGEPLDFTSQETQMEFMLGGMQGLIFTAGGAIVDARTGEDKTAQVTKNGIEQAKRANAEIEDRVIEEVPGVKEAIVKETEKGTEFEVAKKTVLEDVAAKNKAQVEQIAREVIEEMVKNEGPAVKPVENQPKVPKEEITTSPKDLEQTKIEQPVSKEVVKEEVVPKVEPKETLREKLPKEVTTPEELQGYEEKLMGDFRTIKQQQVIEKWFNALEGVEGKSADGKPSNYSPDVIREAFKMGKLNGFKAEFQAVMNDKGLKSVEVGDRVRFWSDGKEQTGTVTESSSEDNGTGVLVKMDTPPKTGVNADGLTRLHPENMYKEDEAKTETKEPKKINTKDIKIGDTYIDKKGKQFTVDSIIENAADSSESKAYDKDGNDITLDELSTWSKKETPKKKLASDEILAKARELGKKAFEAGYKVPAQDDALLEFERSQKSKDTIDIMAEWSRAKKLAELEDKYGGPLPTGMDEEVLLEKYYKIFKRAFELRDSLTQKQRNEFRSDEMAVDLLSKEMELSKDQMQFLEEELAYTPPSAVESLEGFKEFIDNSNNHNFHMILEQIKYLESELEPKVPVDILGEIPEEIQVKSEEDWTDNYAEKYQEFEDQLQKEKSKLKDPLFTMKDEIKNKITILEKEQGEIENQFIDKWTKEAARVDTEKRIAEAKVLGKEAFEDGKKRVPAQDYNLEQVLEGLEVGEAAPILEAWIEGWDKANLAEPLPEKGFDEKLPEGQEEPSMPTAQSIFDRMDENEKAGVKVGLFPKWMQDEMDAVSTGKEAQHKVVVDLMNLAEKGIITADETTTVQPDSIPDSSDISAGLGGERNTEIDERTLHDTTAMPSESGTGPIGSRGKVGRAEANSEAEVVLMAHNYSTDFSEYTEEEINKLRQYSGAGGKETAGATGKGLLSEYYTPKEVTDSVWKIIDSLTPTIVSSSAIGRGTRALEPSIGIGSLLGGMRNGFKFDAYEYQKVSGTIAKILNNDIDVVIGNGEEFGNPGNFENHVPAQEYDLVVGNPPFGERASFLKGKGNEPKINRWEEYFIKRGLDSLRDGGYLVYVVNSSFLNKENTYAKEEIAKLGDLVQAYRLPEGIFADTTIGTDIVVFRKGPVLTGSDSLERLEIQKRVVKLTGNSYFAQYLDNILGETKTRKNKFGQMENYTEGTVADLNRLAPIVETAETVETESAPVVVSDKPVSDKFFINVRQEDGSLKFEEVRGKDIKIKGLKDTFIHQDKSKTWIISEGKTGMIVARGGTQQEAIDSADRSIKMAGPEKVIEMIQKSSDENGVSPRYTGKGVAVSKVKETTEEPYAVKVIKHTKKQAKEGKLPAIITPDKKKVETIPRQTVSGGRVTANEVERKILNNTEVDGSVPYTAEAKGVLNYYQGKYYHDVNYFSGDIYQKIEDLIDDKSKIISELGQAQYDKQLKGLEAVKPKPVTMNDITFDPLDRYVNSIETVPADGNTRGITLLDEFVRFISNSNTPFSYGVDSWDVRNYVTGRRAAPGTKNIMGAIKADSARLFNYYVRNVLSNDVQRQIVDKFNREKNSYVNPDYSKLPVEVDGMAKYFRGKTFKLSDTQSNGVSFLTNKGVGLVAYGVGVGKTHTLLTATVVAKQKGWSKRPVFLVPKSTLTNTWIGTIKAMFPNETIVNLGGLTKPDITRLEKERGKDPKKWIRDGEISVLTHEGLLKLGLSPDEMSGAMTDLTDALGTDNETERAAEKAKGKLTEIIGKAQSKAGNVLIADLGIDHLSVDEIHNFRKVFQGAKPEAVNPDGTVDKSKVKRFANVIGGMPSKMAQQLFLMSQHILKNNNNRGVYLASATPFENHATEVYNILSFMARDRMKKMGIFNINDFFALYSNFETEMDKNVRGEWVNKEKMKSFRNLQQLQKLLREFVDYQVDKTLVRPDRKVLTPTLQMSELQIENLAKIQEMLKPKDNLKPEDGAVLKASTYSVANSISPYFIKEYQPQIVSPEELVDNSPKLKYSMELLKHLKADKKTEKYGNFLYLGANGVEYHNHLADYAVKHLGYKAKEVAVINGSTSNDEREAIKDEFRSGEVKLLIGGDPTKEGIDLQDNGYTTINVSLGWNPTEMAQVEGRVWRQGNKRMFAPIIYPLVENSGDITIYGKYEEKGGRINDLFSYSGQVFDVGELDPTEKKLALMTNPEDKASIAIEIDKAGLQQKRMMFETDIANLKRIEDKITTLKEKIEYDTKRIETGKTDWGSTIEADGLSNYRKDLTKTRRELDNVNEKLEAKKIKDIPAEIARIEALKEEVNIEIGKVQETYKDRLTMYQREEQEMLANRKSIQDHVNDFIEATKDLRELSDEEIMVQKEQLMKDLETKQIADNDLSRYQAPSGNADIGGYADIEPSGVEPARYRSIQFPELVAMVKEITGDAPTLKSFKRKLGAMYERDGNASVKLNPAIFDDPVVATKVLSHEIGHIVDFVPDGFTTRGNLVGHIASLSKFMQGKYGELSNRTIKAELKNLTQLWKPFDETINENFTKYRYSAKELYADAVSILLNDPGLLQQQAPEFYKGFFEYLDAKPEFQQVYFDTLDLLDKGDEFVNQKRIERTYEGYKEAREKRAEIEKEVKPVKPWIDRFMRNHVTKFDPIFRKLSKIDNVGVVESSKQKVREALETYQMRRNDQAIFLDRVTTQITDALEGIGMSEDDLGFVLEREREAFGDRNILANPEGIIGNIPEINLDYWYKEKNLSDEQIKVFEQIKQKFHELMFEEVKRAVQNGNISKQVFEEKIEPNKDTYATFSVIHYINKNYISAGIKKQVGTLSSIENPFTSSVLKTVALIEWNNVQEAKQVSLGELQQYFPDDVKEAKATRTNKGTVIRFKREDGREVLEMMKDGKKVGYNVDPYIKSMFENDNMTADEVHQIVGISRAFNKLFKPLVTTYNLSWGFYSNIIRDTKDTYIKLGSSLNKFAEGKKSLTIGELLSTWLKSIPEGAKFAAGKKDDLIKEMLKNKAITTQWSQYDPNANNDSSIAFLLRKHKIIGEEPTSSLTKVYNKSAGKILEAIKYAGATFEATSKIAGYQIAKRRISDGKRLGFITRNYVGTPNFQEGGAWKQIDNDVFVFSNVMIQGTRASVELAVDPKTASGYWMRTFMVGILPKLLMAAGLSGLFGEWVKRNFQSQTEYDKTNYITVPMGFDENGKAVYVRIPQAESERFLSAIVWKVVSGLAQKKLIKPGGVLAIGAGYIPSVTPMWTALGDWLGYLQGRNPYDSYRGRLAIDDTSWTAGGMTRLTKMVQYSLNTVGVGNFKSYDDSSKSTWEVITDKIPVINRMLQTSSYGIQEQFSSDAGQEAAQKTIAKRELVSKYIKIAKGMADGPELQDLRIKMSEEYFGKSVETFNKDELAEAKRLSKKFMIDRERGSSPYVDKLINSRSNAEKIDYLMQFNETMRYDDFKEMVNSVWKHKIISDTVMDELKLRLKEEGKLQSAVPDENKTAFNFKLVKEAFAAEGITDLKKKLTWSKDDRSGVERFLDNVSKNILGEREWNQPKEAIQESKLNNAQKKEYYDTMMLIRQNDPDWYYQNLGNKIEKRILGFDLGKEEVVRAAIKRGEWTANGERPVEETIKAPVEVQKETAKVTPTGFVPQTNDEVEPAPTVDSPKGTDTPYNDIIKEVFGKEWKKATKILKRTNKNGQIVGENVQLLSGPEVDIPNKTIYDPVKKKRVWNNAPDAPIDQLADPFTGKMIDSIDRGLFRINNETFLTYLRGKNERAKMYEAGIIDEPHVGWDGLTQDVRDKYWDYMLDAEKNIKMAKLIRDKQGIQAWFASSFYD
jgi:hypothetical protein